MARSVRQWLRVFLIIVVVLIVDQVTKQIVVQQLRLGETVSPIPALAPLFQITRSENNGAAFGFLPQAGDIFLIVAVLVVIAMLIFYPRIPSSAALTRFATGLVCGGALGNAIDRLHYGAVIDFIHYQIPGVISNVSNLADHAIVFGVLMIFIESWRQDAKQKPEPPEETSAKDRVS